MRLLEFWTQLAKPSAKSDPDASSVIIKVRETRSDLDIFCKVYKICTVKIYTRWFVLAVIITLSGDHIVTSHHSELRVVTKTRTRVH